MTSCHNCSIPQGACGNVGQTLQVGAEKQYGDKRSRKVTVWTCSENCAVQASGISKYGPATFRWPVTLDQHRALFRREQTLARKK